METEFIYWRHDTPPGIRVEEISGAEDREGRVWLLMARQVYCENGGETYRVIDHFPSGAPLLEGRDARISITHTRGLMAVASLPRTPEADLSVFSPRAALGIDAERADRRQVLDVRSRFLSPEEQAMVGSDDIEANVTAWTAKEAMFKAALTPGMDWCRDYVITRLPDPRADGYGAGLLRMPDGHEEPLELYSYLSEGCVVTLAYSPKCAKFKRN